MIIEKVEFISLISKEAQIHIQGNNFKCVAFAQPCHYEINDEVKSPLHAFNAKNIFICDNKKISIRQLDNSFNHYVVAETVSVKKRLVAVAGIMIELDIPLPGDIVDGMIIEFTCTRLDIY